MITTKEEWNLQTKDLSTLEEAAFYISNLDTYPQPLPEPIFLLQSEILTRIIGSDTNGLRLLQPSDLLYKLWRISDQSELAVEHVGTLIRDELSLVQERKFICNHIEDLSIIKKLYASNKEPLLSVLNNVTEHIGTHNITKSTYMSLATHVFSADSDVVFNGAKSIYHEKAVNYALLNLFELLDTKQTKEERLECLVALGVFIEKVKHKGALNTDIFKHIFKNEYAQEYTQYRILTDLGVDLNVKELLNQIRVYSPEINVPEISF